MGSISFHEYGYGKTAKEVFDDLVAKSREEYGSQSYSGQIKEKEGMGLFEVSKPKNMTIDQCIEKYIQKTSKWGETYYFVIPKAKKISEFVQVGITAKRAPTGGTKQWETLYIVKDAELSFKQAFSSHFKEVKTFNEKSFKTQTAAEKYAKECTAKGFSAAVFVEKKLVNRSQELVVFEPKMKEVLVWVNEYHFFGMASW